MRLFTTFAVGIPTSDKVKQKKYITMTKVIKGIQVPQRADFVGSFLRPANLSDSTRDQLVRELTDKQKQLGYHVITDGEFNRTFWHLDFFWGFGGVAHEDGGDVVFNGETAHLNRVYLTGKLTAQPHPFIDDFRRVQQFEDAQTIAKLTVPSPAQFFQQLIIPQNFPGTKAIYPDLDELISDIAAVYQDFIRQFYVVGGRFLQLDDCTWGAIVGEAASLRYASLSPILDDVKDLLLKVNNLALEGRPTDLLVASHICRGNYHSTWFNSGAYDSVADWVFAREKVDALYLEYDDERSGGFEPLAKVSTDKHVVLGLITTKRPELEDKTTVITRIHEAAKYIPLDRLSLSPQCGFASCAIGNKITPDEQWAKLKLVKEISKEVWGI
ncbi:Methionine synthase II (cobalamin-independent) [Xylanibacter ruminicola]|uniref:Methionine synthase II (Cobalamin-independent) n=2 Tax=Xylanibacter ruminicola TaxID=839 RepID=A0A1H5XGC0_XYLRU|nr:Methionine synthase II (cobalamin-independent) [Xylanibacter ruminicola]